MHKLNYIHVTKHAPTLNYTSCLLHTHQCAALLAPQFCTYRWMFLNRLAVISLSDMKMEEFRLHFWFPRPKAN